MSDYEAGQLEFDSLVRKFHNMKEMDIDSVKAWLMLAGCFDAIDAVIHAGMCRGRAEDIKTGAHICKLVKFNNKWAQIYDLR